MVSDTPEGTEVGDVMDEINGIHMMDQEWRAWQTVVEAWNTTLVMDINNPDFNYIVAAIRWWGENLAALRMSQGEDMMERALKDSYRQMRLAREGLEGSHD